MSLNQTLAVLNHTVIETKAVIERRRKKPTSTKTRILI